MQSEQQYPPREAFERTGRVTAHAATSVSGTSLPSSSSTQQTLPPNEWRYSSNTVTSPRVPRQIYPKPVTSLQSTQQMAEMFSSSPSSSHVQYNYQHPQYEHPQSVYDGYGGYTSPQMDSRITSGIIYQPAYAASHGARPPQFSPDPPPPAGTEPQPPGQSQPQLKPKRTRTTPYQRQTLNDVFSNTSYPSLELRTALGMQLNMSTRSVQIWFQNKRQHCRGHKNCNEVGAWTALRQAQQNPDNKYYHY